VPTKTPTRAIESPTGRSRRTPRAAALVQPSPSKSRFTPCVAEGRPAPNGFRNLGPTRPSPLILRFTLLVSFIAFVPSPSAADPRATVKSGFRVDEDRKVAAQTGHGRRASS